MRYTVLEHRFVEHFPETLEPGVLYVCLEFASVAHSCCCGCGEEVVTPLSPVEWNIRYDGETITLNPSVGSWTLPCRSHYVIRRGRVIEALPWTESEIAAERRRDHRAKALYFGQEKDSPPPPLQPEELGKTVHVAEPSTQRWWQRLLARWRGVAN